MQAHAQSLWHAMQRRNGDAAGAGVGPEGAASQASLQSQQQAAQLAGPLGSSVELSGMSLAEELPSVGLVGGLGSGLWMYDGGLYDMEDMSGDLDAGLFAATPPAPMPPAAAMPRAPAAAAPAGAAAPTGAGDGKGGPGKAAAGEGAGLAAPGKPPLPGQGPAEGAAGVQREALARQQQGHAGGKDGRVLGGQRGKGGKGPGAGRDGRHGRHRVDTATVARKLPR